MAPARMPADGNRVGRPRKTICPQAAGLKRGSAVIRFEPARKGCPDGALALNDLSFEAGSGEITVLVGPPDAARPRRCA